MSLRDQILAAAVRVYAEYGFRGATTRRIAEAAGVNEVTIFRTFGSKSALIHEAMRCRRAEVHGDVPTEPVDPPAELAAWAYGFLVHMRENRSLIRTCFGEIEEHPELRPQEGEAPMLAAVRLRRYVARLAALGLTDGAADPTAAAAMFTGTLFADGMGRDLMPQMFPRSERTAAVQYANLFLRAIGYRGDTAAGTERAADAAAATPAASRRRRTSLTKDRP